MIIILLYISRPKMATHTIHAGFWISLVTGIATGALVKYPVDQVATIGQKVILYCKTDLEYTVYWYFNGHEIFYGGKVDPSFQSIFNLTSPEKGDYNLVIASTDALYNGEYTCGDDEGQGEKKSARLHVTADCLTVNFFGHTMQSVNLNGMQVIVMSQPGLQNEQQTPRSMKPRFVKQLIGLGVVHILNGVFSIIFQSISLNTLLNSTNWYRYLGLPVFGYGFWTGLPFLVTGTIGITAGIRKNNCQVVVFNILSIISAVLASFLIIITVISAYCEFRWSRFRESSIYEEAITIIAMESMLAVVGILEGIIAIWSAIVCCLIGVCNCCLAIPQQTQPMILSGEQQAALMSNQMFTSNQQQSTVGFYPQQQMVQYNKQQSNAAPYPHSNFMPASTVEGAYTGLNRPTGGMRRSLPSVNVDESTCNSTSVYEELHEYDEI